MRINLTPMWYIFGVKTQQITFRLTEASRIALDQAASHQRIGVSTLVAPSLMLGVKAERRRQMREDVARMAGPQGTN